MRNIFSSHRIQLPLPLLTAQKKRTWEQRIAVSSWWQHQSWSQLRVRKRCLRILSELHVWWRECIKTSTRQRQMWHWDILRSNFAWQLRQWKRCTVWDQRTATDIDIKLLAMTSIIFGKRKHVCQRFLSVSHIEYIITYRYHIPHMLQSKLPLIFVLIKLLYSKYDDNIWESAFRNLTNNPASSRRQSNLQPS